MDNYEDVPDDKHPLYTQMLAFDKQPPYATADLNAYRTADLTVLLQLFGIPAPTSSRNDPIQRARSIKTKSINLICSSQFNIAPTWVAEWAADGILLPPYTHDELKSIKLPQLIRIMDDWAVYDRTDEDLPMTREERIEAIEDHNLNGYHCRSAVYQHDLIPSNNPGWDTNDEPTTEDLTKYIAGINPQLAKDKRQTQYQAERAARKDRRDRRRLQGKVPDDLSDVEVTRHTDSGSDVADGRPPGARFGPDFKQIGERITKGLTKAANYTALKCKVVITGAYDENLYRKISLIKLYQKLKEASPDDMWRYLVTEGGLVGKAKSRFNPYIDKPPTHTSQTLDGLFEILLHSFNGDALIAKLHRDLNNLSQQHSYRLIRYYNDWKDQWNEYNECVVQYQRYSRRPNILIKEIDEPDAYIAFTNSLKDYEYNIIATYMSTKSTVLQRTISDVSDAVDHCQQVMNNDHGLRSRKLYRNRQQNTNTNNNMQNNRNNNNRNSNNRNRNNRNIRGGKL